jgi:hypothetical protein
MEYNITYYDRILPQDRESLLALIKFLYDYIEDLNNQAELLNEKLSRKKAVIEFADCPNYSYGDNTFEPTCTKNFCYDTKSCGYKETKKIQAGT